MLFSPHLSSLSSSLAASGLSFATATPALQPWQATNMNIEGLVPIPGATGLSPGDVTISFDSYDPNTLEILPAKRLSSAPITHCTVADTLRGHRSYILFYSALTVFGGNFTLHIDENDSPAALPTAYAGSVFVEDNDPTSPDNYSQCKGGAPSSCMTPAGRSRLAWFK